MKRSKENLFYKINSMKFKSAFSPALISDMYKCI